MTLNPVIIKLLQDKVSLLDEEDIDIVLGLLHNHKCEINDDISCRNCSWCGSKLCFPIRSYLRNWYKENEDE